MPDEHDTPNVWTPPRLSTNYPLFAPFALGIRDGLPLGFVALEGWLIWRGHHATLPGWFVPVWLAVLAVLLSNTLIRPQGTRLFEWALPWLRYALLVLLAPLAWGRIPYRSMARKLHAGGVHGAWTVLLPRQLGHVLHANVRVLGPGVIDVSGLAGPRWVRWLLTSARGKESLRALVRLSLSGSLDLEDPEEQAGVWASRLALLADPGHSLSLHLLVRPFPPDLLARAAGPVAAEARELAAGLVQRSLILAVPAARMAILHKRLADLGVTAEGGLLAEAGLANRLLTLEETEQLLDEAYGQRSASGEREPMLTLSPRRFRIETGSNDPDPLEDDSPAPGPRGERTYRTLVARDLPTRIAVGWTWPVTGGRVLADVAIHLEHVPRWYADAMLQLKASWWSGLRLGASRYAHAAEQAERTLDLLRQRETSVWNTSIVVSVPETQLPSAERAMQAMIGRSNYVIPTLKQREARQAAEPFGRDPLGMRWWTDSHTIAAGWPSSGGIYVDTGVLVGVCARSPEPVCWDPWWPGDETSVGCILGRSGSGKTNAEMALLGRMLEPHPDHVLASSPPPAVVAYYKPYDEWGPFVERFGGEHHHLADTDWQDTLAAARIGRSRIVAFNLIGLSRANQTAFLRYLSDRVMEHQARSNFVDRLLYTIGEAWLMAKTTEGAEHLQQMALQVRTLGIGLLVDSQHADHLYETEARDVIRDASMVLLMRLLGSERQHLGELLSLSPTATKWLTQIAQPQTLSGGQEIIKGRGLIQAHGLLTTVQVVRLGEEEALLDQTNPRRRTVSHGRTRAEPRHLVVDRAGDLLAAGAHRNGHARNSRVVGGADHPGDDLHAPESGLN